MLEELRKRIKAVPFLASAVHVTDERSFPVPHADHILVTWKGLVVIENDQSLLDILPILLVSGIRTQSAAA
jgi:hypothetical protein